MCVTEVFAMIRYMTGWFCINLMQASVIGEEIASVEKMLP